jgi:hypothetical protein
MKALPKLTASDLKKRPNSQADSSSLQLKKPKTQAGLASTKLQELASSVKSQPTQSQQASSDQLDLSSYDQVVENFTQKLTVKENIVNLVIVSMQYLPEQIPSEFLRSYKPISDAGTNQQIRNLAQLLTSLLNDLGVLQLNKPLKTDRVVTIDDLDNDVDMDENDDNGESKPKLMRIKSEKMETLESDPMNTSGSSKFGKAPSTPLKPLPNLQSILPRCTNKTFKLGEVTQNSFSQFTTESLEELLFKTHNRILGADGIYIIICFSKRDVLNNEFLSRNGE